MTDRDNVDEGAETPAWTTPVIEEAGTIHDVEGGGFPGLDGNGFPAALS